ncbi:MAG: Ig-like domain-containing protein [Cyanobacteria bacterium J06560_5]
MSDALFNPEVNGSVLTGNAGNNNLRGTNLNDQIFGLAGRDNLRGLAGADLLEGGFGKDRLFGGRGTDKLDGGADNDFLVGGRDNDWLFGGSGNDDLSGGRGNDDLNGGEGRDTLNGGSGDDLLDGGLGNDVIRLGGGKDIVVLAPGEGTDSLLDYRDGTDKIQLEGGLSFDDLAFRSFGFRGRNTLIRIDKSGDPNDGERLARVFGTRVNRFDASDFIVEGSSNLAPVITSDGAVSVSENQTVVIDVNATDDADAEGAGLAYSFTTNNGGGVDNSAFSIDASTGVLTFVAPPDFEVPGDANADNAYNVQVTVTDAGGLTDSQDITVNVTNVIENTAPTIFSNGGGVTAMVNVAENTTAVTDVETSDDGDSEGSGLTYSLTTNNGGGIDNGLFNLDAVTGVLTFNARPDFEFPGDANADNAYNVQVTVTDAGGLTDSQDITVNVTDVIENTAPTIVSNGGGATATVNVAENTIAVTDVETSDDNDSEGSGLTYSLTTNNGGGIDNNLFSVDAVTGALTFDTAPDFELPGDANADNAYDVQVTVTDSSGLTDSQDITVNVTNVIENTAPVADNDSFATDFQSTLVVPAAAGLLAGDTDADGDLLTANLVTGPSNGTLTLNADGSFDYTANAGFSGDDSFTYVANDGTDNSNEATVTITVGADPNSDPVAVNQSYSTFGNTVLEVAGADVPGNEVTSIISGVNLLNGATDADLDLLGTQAEILTTTEGGTVEIFSDGSFYYIPQAGDGGITDTFSFTVLDGNGGSATATASITVGDRIWYVDDDAAAGGDGTSANPFNSLAPLNTGGSSDSLDGAGDTIYVLGGTYTGGITLENNQSLLGQAVDLVADGTTLITGSNATRPSLSSPGANAITLASGNTVRGLGITGATTQNGIVGSNVGNTLIDNVTFTGLDLEAVQLTNTTSNATIALRNNTVNSPDSATGVEFQVINNGNATGVTANVTNNTLSNVSNSAILVDGNGSGTVNTIIRGNNITVNNAGSPSIEVDQAGNGTITALIDNNTISGQLNDTDAIFVIASNGTGTLNATVTNNSNDTAPTGPIGSGLFGRVQNNNTLNLDIDDNSFVGLNNEDIALVRVAIPGANPTLNITQTNAAALSADNNNAGLFLEGSITFGQPTPQTPIP